MSRRSRTVAAALAEARDVGVDRLDAQLLVAATLRRPRTWLLAHDDAVLSDAEAASVRERIARRAAGEPLAYLLGEKEFHGLLLHVDARVLVPRPDTEVLVDWALELLAGELAGDGAPRVVDLGTGSGAIALAVKHRHPTTCVVATDMSQAALEVARYNAERLQLAVEFRHGAWWEAVGDERFDLGLSNPPYVAAADAHLAALRHEPALALVGGNDGLAALRDIVSDAPRHLRAGAALLLEHGAEQAGAVAELLQRHGFDGVATRVDIAGRRRCTGGRRV